ncbi:unnamed protein product [Caretta caretta]
MLACALDLDDGVRALEISKGAGNESEGPTLKSMRVALLGSHQNRLQNLSSQTGPFAPEPLVSMKMSPDLTVTLLVPDSKGRHSPVLGKEKTQAAKHIRLQKRGHFIFKLDY